MNLNQNPESVSPDERQTSVSSETSDPSEKSNEKVNLSRDRDEAVSER